MRFTFGEFALDSGTRQLLKGGQEIHASPKELALLELLLRARPRAVSRTRLRAALWPDAHVGETSLHVLVSQLRATLGDAWSLHLGDGMGSPAFVLSLATPSAPPIPTNHPEDTDEDDAELLRTRP